jgi:hypothetical protein
MTKQFFAYGSAFTGGVRVAAVDFARNGQVDILVGPGNGMASQVRVLHGQTLAQLRLFQAFGSSFNRGVFVG